MLGKNEKQSSIFQMVIIDDLIPEDFFYRQINKKVGFNFIPNEVKHLYCLDNGRPSEDPELIMCMMLIGFFENFSERKLCFEVAMHAGYRWFCGLDFNSERPGGNFRLMPIRRRCGG
ncbi:MAG: transposase [Bacillota bacterium]